MTQAPSTRRRCWREHGRRKGGTPLWATRPSVSERRRPAWSSEAPLLSRDFSVLSNVECKAVERTQVFRFVPSLPPLPPSK